ncbi:hypothetical protein YPPY14_1137, partial [Yersinia pestis PY-14]|jgi:hypothetical protein
MRNA